jgi:hypothetical protein
MLNNKSLLPPPEEQDTASAEAATWLNHHWLSVVLRIFIMNPKRLALTQNRKALVLTPLSAKAGDEIWILFNGRTPYVLRKIDREEHGYNFVGEAYAHGFMYGELLLRDKEAGLDISIKPVLLI